MIKKLGLFIFGLLTLGLINFSSAGIYTYTGTYTKSLSASSSTSNGSFNMFLGVPIVSYSSSHNFSLNCSFTNFNLGTIELVGDSVDYIYVFNVDSITSTMNCTSKTFNSISCNTYSAKFFGAVQFPFRYVRPNSAYNISFDYSCTFEGDNIINQADLGNSSSSTCESDLSSCQSSLLTLSGNLAICQSDLLNCQNNSFTQDECNLLYSGYVSPTLYQNCTNSLNSCSGELGVCNSSLNSCLNGNYTGGNWSSIWINNIQHLGNKNIFLTIPQEINWDYFYTGEDMNINVEGYNVDSEYIEGIINNQSTLPNQVDLNNIIKNVLPLFVPGLVIILFIYFVFRFIKKIF